MLTRDLQSRLAETRRVTTQNEEWGRDVKALRADLFAREGRLGRVEAELAAADADVRAAEAFLTAAAGGGAEGDGVEDDGEEVEVEGDVVHVDFNHPLAGLDLHFEGVIVALGA